MVQFNSLSISNLCPKKAKSKIKSWIWKKTPNSLISINSLNLLENKLIQNNSEFILEKISWFSLIPSPSTTSAKKHKWNQIYLKTTLNWFKLAFNHIYVFDLVSLNLLWREMNFGCFPELRNWWTKKCIPCTRPGVSFLLRQQCAVLKRVWL